MVRRVSCFSDGNIFDYFLEFEFSEALEFDSYANEISHGYLFYEKAES